MGGTLFDQLGVERPPAGAAGGPRVSRNARVAVDVDLGHAVLTKLVGLGFGGAAGGSLDSLPAGPDIDASRHAGAMPLWDTPAQAATVTYKTVL